MVQITINYHSFVNLITNSSTELFTVDTQTPIYVIEEMFDEKCKQTEEMKWFDFELSIYENPNGTITIYSFLNEPSWFEEFIYKNFTVISHD